MRLAGFSLALMSLTNLILVSGPALAESITSQYSKLDFENGCQWKPAESEEEEQMGGEAVCNGFGNYPVFFAESDLRQFLAYGPADDPFVFSSGFSQWNSVHDVIEWRLEDGVPFATIHRWFIDNIDPDTGSADAKRRGQVLAIATVAEPEAPAGKKVSCVVGYVDALANDNANELAREVADGVGRLFLCGRNQPQFYGVQGPYSGTANAIAE
jgi:hypothetical protein